MGAYISKFSRNYYNNYKYIAQHTKRLFQARGHARRSAQRARCLAANKEYCRLGLFFKRTNTCFAELLYNRLLVVSTFVGAVGVTFHTIRASEDVACMLKETLCKLLGVRKYYFFIIVCYKQAKFSCHGAACIVNKTRADSSYVHYCASNQTKLVFPILV